METEFSGFSLKQLTDWYYVNVYVSEVKDMEPRESCPMCFGTIYHDYDSLTMRVIYQYCGHCFAYEEGGKINLSDPSNRYILRLGFSVVRGTNFIYASSLAEESMSKESRELLKTKWSAYIRQLFNNPDDNAIYAIMLDEIQDDPTEEERFSKLYPRTFDILVRRRAKAHGKKVDTLPNPMN